jgi:hypothetical protein
MAPSVNVREIEVLGEFAEDCRAKAKLFKIGADAGSAN